MEDPSEKDVVPTGPGHGAREHPVDVADPEIDEDPDAHRRDQVRVRVAGGGKDDPEEVDDDAHADQVREQGGAGADRSDEAGGLAHIEVATYRDLGGHVHRQTRLLDVPGRAHGPSPTDPKPRPAQRVKVSHGIPP